VDRYKSAVDKVRREIHEEWKSRRKLEGYGVVPPYSDCWRFMTLPKFQASRLYQLRAGKSYLKVYRDWKNEEEDPMCDRYSRKL
jgi:hypothetical protein